MKEGLHLELCCIQRRNSFVAYYGHEGHKKLRCQQIVMILVSYFILKSRSQDVEWHEDYSIFYLDQHQLMKILNFLVQLRLDLTLELA